MTPLEKLLSREGVRVRWMKAQGNQMNLPAAATLLPEDIIDITQSGEDRWINTLVQTVDPRTNPHAMKAKWIAVVDEQHVTRLENALKAAAGLREALVGVKLIAEGASKTGMNWLAHTGVELKMNEALAAFDKALGEGK